MNTYIICLTQYDNVGDLLINKMLIDELSKYGEIYLDCPFAPEDFKSFLFQNDKVIDVNNIFNVSFKTTNFISLLSFLKKQEIKLFLQSPGPFKPHNKRLTSIYFGLFHKLLKKIQIPYYRIGNCCSTISARKIPIKLKDNAGVYVRSYKGVEYIRKNGYHNVHYIPDLAFMYKDLVRVSEKEKIAVFSFREVTKDKSIFIDWLRHSIDVLMHDGYRIEFFYQVKRDETFMRELFDQVTSDNVSFRKQLLWYDSFDYYSDKEIVVSNRLHSLLLGASYGAIPLAFMDNNDLTHKIIDVFSSSFDDYDEYMIDSMDIGKLAYILNNIDEIRKRLSANCMDNAKLCHETIKKVVNTVN